MREERVRGKIVREGKSESGKSERGKRERENCERGQRVRVERVRGERVREGKSEISSLWPPGRQTHAGLMEQCTA